MITDLESKVAPLESSGGSLQIGDLVKELVMDLGKAKGGGDKRKLNTGHDLHGDDHLNPGRWFLALSQHFCGSEVHKLPINIGVLWYWRKVLSKLINMGSVSFPFYSVNRQLDFCQILTIIEFRISLRFVSQSQTVAARGSNPIRFSS